MAKVETTEFIKDIKGAIGDTVYSRMPSGTVAKSRSYSGSRNPYTYNKSQRNLQSLFAILPVQWSLITETERTGWNRLASVLFFKNAFGKPYHVSGYILYITFNSNLQMINQTIISTPPQLKSFKSLYNCSLSITNFTAPNIIIKFTGITTDINCIHLIYSAQPFNAGRNYVGKLYKIIGAIPAATANAYNITQQYLYYFKFPVDNKKVFIKLIPIDKRSGNTGTITTFYSIFSSPTPESNWLLDSSHLNFDTKLS